MSPSPQSVRVSESANEDPQIDPQIWKQCAGSSVQIPIVNSRVYYFPQGHMEQSVAPNRVRFSPAVYSKPRILCRISAVLFHADRLSDEVFVRMLLVPVDYSHHHSTSMLYSRSLDPSRVQFDGLRGEEEEVEEEDKVVSVAKVLTPSDANNGGGFSVPRYCAELIFPPLDFEADPPVQNLFITDVLGDVWEFRHIYRGTPRRHLLTTGWSKFVNGKNLVAGDSVVFMRKRGKLFVGIRRAVRSCWSANECRYDIPVKMKEEEVCCGVTNVFSRSGKGRISVDAVVEAAELAAQDLPFEVVYDPRAGWSNFVVRAEVVEEALNVVWSAGMRVKMPVETEDSSRMTWFQGTVSACPRPNDGPWQGSPWRMLQVKWDEPEALQNKKRVSPWQVEYMTSSPLHTVFHPGKRFKVSLNSELLTDGEEDFFHPKTGLPNPTMGHLDASLLRYNTSPDGMQGARQNSFLLSPRMCTDNLSANITVSNPDAVSPDLNLGSSHTDDSLDSQGIVNSFTMKVYGDEGCSSTNSAVSSIQLFGKVIHMEQPEDDGSEGKNENWIFL